MLLFRLVIGFRISQVIFQQQSVWDHVKGAHALDSSKDFDRSTITAVEAVAGRPMNALLPRTLDRGQMLSSLFITINLELLDKLLVFVMHLKKQSTMSESNFNVIPAINTVDGFNPADFVRTTVGEEGENDLYLDVKYRLLWFRLHHPNGKIDPELIRVDEKNAIVCCRIYADKADPADQFIGKAYSQRFSTEDRFGDRFLEIAETVAKGRALADAGYGTQFCMNGEALASIIADAPIKMPPDEDAGHPGSVVASFTAQPTADPPVFSQTATAPKSTQPAQQQVQPPVQQSHAPAPEPPKTLDEYLRVMTIEQAKAVKVDFGRFSGWSLGEIAMKSPGDLAWYVKNYSGHNLALKAGATKLLETVGQMAS